MDIFLNIALLFWTLIALIQIIGIFTFLRYDWDDGAKLYAIIQFLVVISLVLNNYLGTEIINGKVYAVSKVNSDQTVTTVISSNPSTQITRSLDILEAYEVALLPSNDNTLRIINNKNNLWQFKFNKRAIQIQVQPDSIYKFRIHRLVGKNIVEIL